MTRSKSVHFISEALGGPVGRIHTVRAHQKSGLPVMLRSLDDREVLGSYIKAGSLQDGRCEHASENPEIELFVGPFENPALGGDYSSTGSPFLIFTVGSQIEMALRLRDIEPDEQGELDIEELRDQIDMYGYGGLAQEIIERCLPECDWCNSAAE